MPLTLVAAVTLMVGPSPDPGPLVRALWMLQRFGTVEAVNPANDHRVKGQLFRALGKEGEITFTELGGFMDADTFKRLAGADGKIDAAEIKAVAESVVPESRTHLLPKIREYADALTTSFDMIDDKHRDAGIELAEWVAAHYRAGQKLHVTVICTGNSRRSILGSTLGNVAAAYYGMPEICFHSGGTAPTSFNTRTVAALRDVGVAIEPTGTEAARGEPKTENPMFRVRWGTPASGGPAFEALEFSKKFDDAANPKEGFAALMVCGEADEACPLVRGASERISMPYLDPKIYDGSAFETMKYAERRDDMGRLMLSAMMQARHRLAAAGKQGKGE